jgi:hypothetical protein
MVDGPPAGARLRSHLDAGAARSVSALDAIEGKRWLRPFPALAWYQITGPVNGHLVGRSKQPIAECLWLMFRHDLSEFGGQVPSAVGTFRDGLWALAQYRPAPAILGETPARA